jgi:hypothetical protein
LKKLLFLKPPFFLGRSDSAEGGLSPYGSEKRFFTAAEEVRDGVTTLEEVLRVTQG